MANTKLRNRIEIRRAGYSNIDALYGPYEAKDGKSGLEIAKETIGSQRGLGMTIGVIENGEVVEYQWKRGLGDDDLEPKVEKFNLTIAPVGDTTVQVEEGQIVNVQISISGRAALQKGQLYQVYGTSEIFVTDLPNLIKGTNSVQITNISTAGVYHYRIKVLDSSGTPATTAGNVEYVEYEIRYGGISAIYNFNNLNSIAIKNIYSVANQYFTCNISVRDDSFVVTAMKLSDGTHVTSLAPKDAMGQDTSTFIGNNYYFLPSSTDLEPYNGKACYLVLEYTEGGTAYSKTTSLFTLLDTSSLELIPESTGTEQYYLGLPSYFVFQLQSGVENISVTLSPNAASDFSFENVTVASYKRFSLKVIPNKVKNNAEIKLDYSFYYNNHEYTGTFTSALGNIQAIPPQSYYEPAATSTTTRDDVIFADASDYDVIEDGQYYKIIDTPVVSEHNTCACLIDMYCKINKIDDKTVKYVTIKYGNEEIGYITEDEINCRGISTDTPLDEWVQIGIGYNLYEQIERNSETIPVSYFAIYVNGMVVKNVLIDNQTVYGLVYDPQKKFTIEINNGIFVQKCFDYYINNGSDRIVPNTEQTSIIYNNYRSHNVNFHEPDDLPELKLRKITDAAENEKFFNLINEQKDGELKHTTVFGTIGSKKATDMNEYDGHYSSTTIESNASLFRQSVDIKKPAQKEYAVLCYGKWKNDEIDCIVEVHTQGTSTLVYSVPNFKFTFWKLNSEGTAVEPYYPEFIKKSGNDEYYHEYIYTAKCDYMDSSHLNNTPTCNFYNNLIKTLMDGNEIDGSPSAQNGGIDAIMGFPIVMEISDSADTFDTYFTNIGSFMLNVDKTGESLGFEIDNPKQSCISFEGTSNDNEHGAAGRFILSDNRLTYFADDAAIETAYNNTKAAIDAKLINEPGANDPIGDLAGYPYAQWCQFFSDGLEYRYPDSDIIKSKNNKLSKVMALADFKKLYRMWEWVSKSDAYDNAAYKSQFVNYFDLDYCMLYFIQLMIFAQTDNLGKNAMFDCWDGEHWYPRPYDLDSQAGLDNNGNDNIAPFVEIKPEFSLNWNASYTEEEKRENYLLEDSQIKYGTQWLDRYHYSSNSSKLWINFYKNFKNEIEAFYSTLRNQYAYDPQSIIDLCNDQLISVLGISQYNQDFENKYLANSDQHLAYGNRWYKFKKWITQRFAFCDSYFGASESATYSATSAFTYNIKVNSPQYIIQQYQASSITKFVIDATTFSTGSSAATKTTLKVNQGSVLETTFFKYVTRDFGDNNFSGLIYLDVSGNSKITGITGLVGANLPDLKELNISNSGVNTLEVPAQLKKLTADSVNMTSLTFANNCLIEELSLKNSTLNGDINITNLPNLKKLDLTNCKIKANITLANLDSLDTFTITDASFEGEVIIQDGVKIQSFDFTGLSLNNITFSGSNLQIHTLNFHSTIFGQSRINLNAVSKNIEHIYFNNCTGLKHIELTGGNKFDSLETFSLTNSSISALGTDDTQFDGSVFTNISALKRVTAFNNNGTVTTAAFTFQNTVIEKIVNLNWNGSGASLFANCTALTSIAGSMTLTTSINSMFYRCSSLATIPSTVNVNDSVVSATSAFVMNNALGYANVSSIIKKCKMVTTFANACQCTKFAANQTINLSDLFSNNSVVENINYMFTPASWGNNSLTSTTNTFVLTGKLPASIINANRTFYGVSTLSVPYDIFSGSNIQDMSAMLGGSTITFTGSGLPTYQDSHEQTITLTNTVNANFFPTTVRNMSGLFYGTNVQIINADVFKSLTNLTSCNSMFGSGNPRKFSIKDSEGQTVDINLNIQTLWDSNPNLTNVSGCFANVYNVYCTGLNFHNSVTDINISGLFGLSNATYKSSQKIFLNIDAIVPAITTDNNYSVPGNTGNYYGVFQNREVHISTNAQSVLSKLSTNCKNLFYGATIYVGDVVKKFDLSNVKNCTNMFRGCNVYKYNADESHTYTDNDRYFVNVDLPTSCTTYTYMFASSVMLQSLPNISSPSASDLSYMFNACYINQTEVRLPYDYFDICRAELKNVSYMFFNNHYITELLYNENAGLFEDCVQLSNVNHMFDGAHFLHKGIPNNLFGTTQIPYITTLTGMFRESMVMYDIEDDSYKWVDTNTFAPLVNLRSIEEIFSRNKFYNPVQGYGSVKNQVTNGGEQIYVISPNTFTTKSISIIRSAFKFFALDIPFEFLGFEYGRDAFFDSAITAIDSLFVQDTNISMIRDVSRMFYDITNTPVKTIDGLGAFVTKISAYSNIQKANIAGNLLNEDVPASLKENSAEADGEYFNGFNMSSPSERPFYNS